MPIERIAIVGGGLAGWMAASVLARVLGPVLAGGPAIIEVIHNGGADTSLGPYLPLLSSLPSARSFHARFGYDEDSIIRQADGCFSLGQALSGWATSGTPCFHPYAETGAPIGHVGFHHLAQRLRRDGKRVNLPDFSLGALCAQTNRFIRPRLDDGSVLSTLDYGLTLDTGQYTEFFRADAIARGVIETISGPKAVILDDNGQIDRLLLNTNRIAQADFYIDCTGAQATLYNAVDGKGFESWQHWLPGERLVAITGQASEVPVPYTHHATSLTGWKAFTASRSRRMEAETFSGAPAEQGWAEQDNIHYFQAGVRAASWIGNCIALGAAATVINPVSALQLHILQSSLERLVELLPNTAHSRIEARNYNRQTLEELECVRDWAILAYKINGRTGDAFWDDCRAMPIPDRLDHKIEVYRATGRIALYDGEIMDEADWVAIFDAQGIYPRRYDPAADGITVELITDHFQRIREIMIREVSRIPFHHDYLGSIVQ
jgi:tryptophan 7-halogenase